MAFHDVQFPTDVSYGSRGGPGFNTAVVATKADAEQRIPRRQIPRRSWNAAYGVKSVEQVAAVRTFYTARMGAAHSFRYKDFSEFTTAEDHISPPTNTDETLGSIPSGGAPYTFQARKTFTSGGVTITQNITKPIPDTVVVAVNGVALIPSTDFIVDGTTGEITITTSQTIGQTVTYGAEYDHHARFAEAVDDLLAVSIDNFSNYSIDDIPLVEVLSELPVNDQRVFGGGRYYAEVGQVPIDTGAFAYAIDPDDAPDDTTSAVLPSLTNLYAGGPYFSVKNVGSVGDVIVEFPAGTTLVSLLPSEIAIFSIGVDSAGDKTWEYL